MTYLNWGLIILAALSFLAFIITVVYYRLKKRYTRERFIARASFNLFTLILLLANSILPNSIVAEVFNALIIKYTTIPLSIGATDWFSTLVIGFLIIFYLLWSFFVFKSWEGSKKTISLRQAKEEEINASSSLLKDWQVGMMAFIKENEMLQIYTKIDEDLQNFDIPTAVGENLQWHQQAAELLELYSDQYSIHTKKDWYVSDNTFITSYGKNTILTGIFCLINPPNEKEIAKFIQFVESHKKNPTESCKLIIACKKGTFVGEKTFQSKEITFATENSLLDKLINFASYYEGLRYNFEEKEITKGFPFSLQDTYTELSASIGEEDKEKSTPISNVESYIFDWINNTKTNKHLAILAEYGQGKSVLSERIAYLITSGQVDSNRIPIVIPLRGLFLKGYSNVIDLLSVWGGMYGINPQALLKLHHAGKLLIIFEGFDETELVGDYEIRLDHFRKLWEFSIPKAKIMITGRPNFFLNDKELSTLLQTERAETGLPYCEEIYLQKFSLSKIKTALRHASQETQAEIIQTLEKQSNQNSFFDLMSRPSLLFLASTVWKERNLSQYKNNINSAIVIDEFLQYSYSRQDNKNLKTPLAVEERAYFMKGIAIGMIHKNGYTNQIGRNDFLKLIEKLYEAFPDSITKQLVHKHTHQKEVKNRFDQKYNKETIFADIQSCGILVKDLAVRDTFKFAHKSFLELLASQLFMKSILEKKETKHTNDIDTDQLIKNTIEKALNVSIAKLEKSPDTTRFVAQLIAKNIKLDSKLSNKEQIKTLFSSIYTRKWVPMAIALKGIPFFGKSLLDNVYLGILFRMIIFIITVGIVIGVIGLGLGALRVELEVEVELGGIVLGLIVGLIVGTIVGTIVGVGLIALGLGKKIINKLFFKFKSSLHVNFNNLNSLIEILGGIAGAIIVVVVVVIGIREGVRVGAIVGVIVGIVGVIGVIIRSEGGEGVMIMLRGEDLGLVIAKEIQKIRQLIIQKIVGNSFMLPNRKFSTAFLDDSKEDKNNLILWFIACKELKLEQTLREILSPAAYHELEYNEALFNKDVNKLLALYPQKSDSSESKES